jgi:hypothetical protein
VEIGGLMNDGSNLNDQLASPASMQATLDAAALKDSRRPSALPAKAPFARLTGLAQTEY